MDLSRPKRLLEQIKGISEQKATKVLVECKSALADNTTFLVELFANGLLDSRETRPYGIHNCY